ncbi:response regulator [Aquisalimonas asiatica]|uniref:DNA-binding response regulator, NarL/FixJ family, contains REC and HTH domains n=1 Tax=Aquisalimonas asiatica TaxID=406100 RepID=A0A1H8S679_9GAMM|nr:response regulator transcription factor [Aquisalimonas asiatica]SEO74122.1 DNA-binding response regulator, NarL/FixJ family, contains REC and HTH domains [Aquisalimonas asiatica]
MARLTPDHARNLLLVDDHAVVRAGFRRLLEQARTCREVLEAGTGEQACRLCADRPFALVVLDLSLPGISGLETLTRIRGRRPDQRVLVMSMHDSPSFVTKALDAGAAGYVTKASAPDVLVTAVTRVLDGHRFLGPDVDHGGETTLRPDPDLAALSPREFEIFRRLAAGEKVAHIAATLSISYKTAANYGTLIRTKLAADSAADLARLAIRAGVMEA